MKTRVEEYARTLDPQTVKSVRAASAGKVIARLQALPLVFSNPEEARLEGERVKSFVLDQLKELLLQFEANCKANGIQVHWANDAASANRQILEICQSKTASKEDSVPENPNPVKSIVAESEPRDPHASFLSSTVTNLPDQNLSPAWERSLRNEAGEGGPVTVPKTSVPNCPARERSVSSGEPGERDNDLLRARHSPKPIVVKAKSMATEEIHLNKHLEEAGFEVVETDLGEFVVQIDGDTPSHIVTPIIHKSLKQVSASFDRERLGPHTEIAEELTMQARAYLRDKFRRADIGISGVNFAIASSGRLVLVENEGNNRFSTTAPNTHIAIMGIEKLIPHEEDLATFLPLLACSATGQKVTTYTHFIKGPRQEDERDGPEEVHLILLDNGRSKVLGSRYRDILRCIRCGACLNVCPVYRQASGHGYGHVYSGPLGAVLAPALEGTEKMGDLAKASSLCGACEEVCPVKIPIPHMLLMLRDEDFRKGIARDRIPWGLYAAGARRGFLWRLGLKLLPMAEKMPNPLKSEWEEFRTLPHREGRDFRSWWNGRS